MKEKKESYFWAGYADLMTSLFFVMLVMFVLTISALERQVRATERELEKIKEVQKATENIDSKYFRYDIVHKKHILNIQVQFETGWADMDVMSHDIKMELLNAGRTIENFVKSNSNDGIQYILIIEGQSSKDQYSQYDRNYELSYERALALKKFWENRDINFGDNCDVLVSGSGDGKLSGTGFMRSTVERENQRFLIHIIPKYGTI